MIGGKGAAVSCIGESDAQKISEPDTKKGVKFMWG
jgi:hypothetical protein